MTVDEALWAATQGRRAGAASRRRRPPRRRCARRLRVLDAPRAAHLAYRPGANVVAATYRARRQ